MSKQSDAENPPESRQRWRRIALLSLAAVFMTLGTAYGIYWGTVGRFRQSTDDAYVAGNRVPVMAQVRGTVVAVLADDTMRVHRGETLVQLDDADERIALQQAKAGLAAIVREVNAQYATERQLRAQVAKEQATLALARRDYSRNKDLHALGYFSTKSLEHSGTQMAVDARSLTEAQQSLQAVRAKLANTDVAGNPQVLLAAARLRAAYLALQRTRILAPVSGYVAKRAVQVGDAVGPGTALMAVVPLNQIWVEANFKESDLGSIHIGQPAAMHADMYGDSVTFHGRVIGLGAGTGSAFSLLPPENATGNWIKVVQRVPVRIGIAKSDLVRHPLRIGLSMDVTVHTGGRDGGADSGPIVDPGVYKTSVYADQTKGANRLIARIISENIVGEPVQRVASAKAAVKGGRGNGR